MKQIDYDKAKEIQDEMELIKNLIRWVNSDTPELTNLKISDFAYLVKNILTPEYVVKSLKSQRDKLRGRFNAL